MNRSSIRTFFPSSAFALLRSSKVSSPTHVEEYNQSMGATTTLVTVPEFFAMPEPEGERLELIGGEIVSMSFGHIPHEVVKKNITKILVLWLAQNSEAELFAETMYRVND